jgi:aspartate 1-decarboxylase
MQRLILKSMLVGANITSIDSQRAAGIAIDAQLLDLADIVEYEQVEIVNSRTYARAQTFVLRAGHGQGAIILGQALAELAAPSDKLMVTSYAIITSGEAAHHWPRLIQLNEKNRPIG